MEDSLYESESVGDLVSIGLATRIIEGFMSHGTASSTHEAFSPLSSLAALVCVSSGIDNAKFDSSF